MSHKMSWELPVGMHVQLYSKTGTVCHFFCRKYLTQKSCTCSAGATGMGFPAAGWASGLAATWAAGWAALLVQGLARGLAALGARLAGGLAGGSSPCDKQFASGTSHAKYNFPSTKSFASLHTPRALVAHTISVSDALSLSCSTPLGRPLSIDVNDETSASMASCEASDDDLDNFNRENFARGKLRHTSNLVQGHQTQEGKFARGENFITSG